ECARPLRSRRAVRNEAEGEMAGIGPGNAERDGHVAGFQLFETAAKARLAWAWAVHGEGSRGGLRERSRLSSGISRNQITTPFPPRLSPLFSMNSAFSRHGNFLRI